MVSSKRGIAFVWLGVIVILFVVMALFIVFNQPYEKVKEITTGNRTGTQFEETEQKIDTMWNYFPLALLGSLILYGILTALRENQ